ncbi:hypothetical protein RSAG8_09245, partial [Rhizoctonia solani AG-8 WAC10335]
MKRLQFTPYPNRDITTEGLGVMGILFALGQHSERYKALDHRITKGLVTRPQVHYGGIK